MKRLLILIAIAVMAFVCITGCEKKEVNVPKEEEPTVKPEEPDEPEEPVKPEETKPEEVNTEAADVIIEISWDESDVTFFEDSLLMDYSISDVCQPCVYIEGESVEREVFKKANIHTEKLTIKDPNEYVNITVQPCQPTNECPLDTATATITYTDGTVKNLGADEMKTRGQTGIWYLDVYTQN